jgi:hypothetical protein
MFDCVVGSYTYAYCTCYKYYLDTKTMLLGAIIFLIVLDTNTIGLKKIDYICAFLSS